MRDIWTFRPVADTTLARKANLSEQRDPFRRGSQTTPNSLKSFSPSQTIPRAPARSSTLTCDSSAATPTATTATALLSSHTSTPAVFPGPGSWSRDYRTNTARLLKPTWSALCDLTYDPSTRNVYTDSILAPHAGLSTHPQPPPPSLTLPVDGVEGVGYNINL